jgi:hypothetical protein
MGCTNVRVVARFCRQITSYTPPTFPNIYWNRVAFPGPGIGGRDFPGNGRAIYPTDNLKDTPILMVVGVFSILMQNC